jgi:hypothetical protein
MCGFAFPRSACVRKADGLLYCREGCAHGRDRVTLNRLNAEAGRNRPYIPQKDAGGFDSRGPYEADGHYQVFDETFAEAFE